ncbi:hypothetical protein TWF481_012050 [Arthrobotrys musiformis]|uniref:HNH nuclease domain-containing protein n=1 Tax=Arthrobotrys musiformis TaxID=47236 RepID=A0AAV9VVY2_9PEZI
MEEKCEMVGVFKAWWRLFKSIFKDGQAVTECSQVKVNFNSRLATREEYDKFISLLDASMQGIYSIINTWICRHEMTDKSMTYFTLFKREEKDIRAKDGLRTFAGLSSDLPRLVHFLDDYPEVTIHFFSSSTFSTLKLDAALLKALTEVTGDIGDAAPQLYLNLKKRAAFTKWAMETFGIVKDTKEDRQSERQALLLYCSRFEKTFPYVPPMTNEEAEDEDKETENLALLQGFKIARFLRSLGLKPEDLDSLGLPEGALDDHKSLLKLVGF